MVLTEHDRDDVRLQVWGDLDASHAGDLRRELERVASQLTPRALVVVEVANLSFIDSAGIRVLLDGQRAIHHAGGRFRLVASEALRRLLELSGMSELLVADT
jgi:anti-anti-sigma factor